jgi:hypothetical protein
VIANRIKPVLSRFLSEEQLGFLGGHQIQDAIGTTHECIHSIKKKKQKSLILKLDLQKAYDCISWDYVGMVLIQVGFGLHMMNYILVCVNLTSFVVLVNGKATDFLRSGRGLRQGCPLSPLLFILVMESLSLLLKQSQRQCIINGICYPPKLHYGEFPASRQRLNIIVQNSEFRNSAGLKDHLVTLHFHKKL